MTGLPFVSEEVRLGREALVRDKRNKIAFPHRLTSEKNPAIIERLRAQFGKDSVIVTREVSNSKKEYLDILATCRVCISDSRQETFGYSMLEATALGCIPIVPERLSYPEMYPPRYRFKSDEEMLSLAGSALRGDFKDQHDLDSLITWADASMDRVLDVVLKW